MVPKENGEEQEERLSHLDKTESDFEPGRDSVSSQGEAQGAEENKAKRSSRVPQKIARKHVVDGSTHSSRARTERNDSSKLQFRSSNNTKKKSDKPNRVASATKSYCEQKLDMKVGAKPPSESSEGADEKIFEDKTIEEVKDIDVLDETPNCDHSVGTDNETVDTEENSLDEDKVITYQKIEEMEQRIEKLEEELKEVAALEISLYSVVPEHGSSAHKVHTPARRLSRMYIHACKYWTRDKRATVARNTVSGLVLIAKSCGNDVARLTFWLSNTVVLREIISEAFGSLSHSSFVTRVAETNGNGNKTETRSSTAKWKNNTGMKGNKKTEYIQLVDDWQETSTYTMALEKIESWMFSRIVESVWWQTLTPHMQSPMEDTYKRKSFGKLLGPALGDQQQGTFSIDLWKSAFLDAFTRLCPLRAGGHECGCLPVLARMVMGQCVSRLDVAMFNAILRESANEIPTDPVSDPIVDPKVLPIPAGDLSFGSGAQLKNSIGNWSRWLTDLFGMDADDSVKEGSDVEDDDRQRGDAESKCFQLLNSLSDLLMLPKDMLLDRSIRKEVCPSIGLPLITRILCNFTPDEFCPDPVPGAVLEELNSEGLLDRRQSDKDCITTFPYPAAPVVYSPPSAAHVSEKVVCANGKADLGRNASMVQRKGYTSDEDLEDLDSPLISFMDRTPPVSPANGNGNLKSAQVNMRFELLREVWSA